MGWDVQKIISERLTLRIWMVAVIGTLLGGGVLFLTAHENLWINHKAWQVLLEQVGSLTFITAAITLVWDLFAKRAFLEEILAKTRLSRDIETSGIIQVSDSFHDTVRWDEYIRNSDKIDTFFAYGNTWREAHRDALKAAARKKIVRIRAILPDFEHEETIANLATRFGYTNERLIEYIKDAEKYFRDLPPTNGTGAQVDIWFYQGTPVFTFYRFDKIVVLALYMHRRERAGVPTFVCRQGGTLCDYIHKELDAMLDLNNGLTRKA
ncbi:MAG: hypothetical protein JW804_05235 [Sedimentisphaerales bacterium]|nr:hypothetical protein [Sedimentisphaerales bacterium]